jgi:hypothetical protein
MFFKQFKMSKKMKPEKIPPSEGNTSTANGSATAAAPTMDISEAALAGMELESLAPQLTPPEKAEGIKGIETAVWSSDKRVNALYTTYNPHNSWMGIAGVGWKKLAIGSNSATEAMTMLAAHCREKNCRIDYSEENGLVKEIYVW